MATRKPRKPGTILRELAKFKNRIRCVRPDCHDMDHARDEVGEFRALLRELRSALKEGR